jgi:hypothetical protein
MTRPLRTTTIAPSSRPLHLDLRASNALTKAPRIELEQLPAESDRVILRYDARMPHTENPRTIQLSWDRAVGYT